MKALLLEIRGVLNDYRRWYYDEKHSDDHWVVDQERLKGLKKIVDQTGADIFLFDTWREHWYEDESLRTERGHYLNDEFLKAGLTIKGKTKRHANDYRKNEFDYFFIEHDDVESYVILDWVNDRFKDIDYNRVAIDEEGFTESKINETIKLLNTPTKIIRNIPKYEYKIVLVDHILPLDSRDREIEEKYAGRFVYKKAWSDMGRQDIVRIDRVEVDEEYKEIALKAELYACKKFTGDESVYYRHWMVDYGRIMSYACVCDRWSLYYSYKKDGFAKQGVKWLSYKTLNPGLFGDF